MNPNYLLTLPLAQRLYREVAASLPIVDYHNHLCAQEIRENRKFENITRLWVAADPYKHRAMRILGVEERFITGNASDEEKFRVWYESLPRLIGNPLFDWSMMELHTVFGMEMLPLRPWQEVWQQLNAALQTLTPQDILGKFNILYSAPCTALTDDLSVYGGNLAPSLRGDDLLLPTPALLQRLEKITGTAIGNLNDYLQAVETRLAAFRAAGCRFADHALDNGFRYVPDDGENPRRFAAILAGQTLSPEDQLQLRSRICRELLVRYAAADFTVQLHIGAQRSTSTRLKAAAGATGGFAAMGSCADVASLTRLFDDAEQQALPKILLFTLNPADNGVMATLSGSYSKDGQEALISQGPAWWWCDHYQGIFDMLDNFCCHSLLSTFVGMTTDSRSLLSFVRHDYFRRCLCQWMAEQVSRQRLPDDFEILADTVRRICFENANKRIGG